MSRGLLLGLLLGSQLTMGCGPRPWNYDESWRISEVMRQGDDDPREEAFTRSVAAGEMPALAPYSPPVFVRPRTESRRRPEVFRRRKFTSPTLWKPSPQKPPGKADTRTAAARKD